eukprot:189103_1
MVTCISAPLLIENCSFIALNVVLFIFCILAAQKLIKKYNKKRFNMFWVGIMYIAAVTLMAIYWMLTQTLLLINCNKLHDTIYQIGFAIYGMQIYWLWMVLFCRLYFVFKGSAYEISSYSIYTVTAFFVVMPIWVASGWLPWPQKYHNIVAGITLLLSTIFNILISYLFLYKLYIVFKDTKQKEENSLLLIIRKNTLLAVISISVSLIANVIYVIASFQVTAFTRSYKQIKNYPMLWAVFLLIYITDVYVNFICVMLSYSFSYSNYLKVCKYGDNLIKSFCIKVIFRNNADGIQLAGNMESPTSVHNDAN